MTYPVNLAVAGRSCLVVGGGRVAARKVAGLLDAGARVTVVAPDLDERLVALAGDGAITLRQRHFEVGDVTGHSLVITATGNAEVDAAVATAADADGVWVNSADDPANCSFILPAVHRCGPVSVAISTGGVSPALATWLRRRIDGFLDELVGDGIDDLAGLLAEGRANVKASGRSTESLDWQTLLNGPFLDLVREGRIDEARRLLDEMIG